MRGRQTDGRILDRCITLTVMDAASVVKLKFHGSSFSLSMIAAFRDLNASMSVHVVLFLDCRERHRHTDKRAASTTPQQTAGAWQALRRSRRTRPTCYGHPREDIMRMLRGKWSRGI